LEIQFFRVCFKFRLKTLAVALRPGRSKTKTRNRKETTMIADAMNPKAPEYFASTTRTTGASFNCSVCRKHFIAIESHLLNREMGTDGRKGRER